MNQREWDEELSYFHRVIERLRTLLHEREHSLDDAQQALAQSRAEMWENGRHIIRDLDDALDVFSMTQVVVRENLSVERSQQEVDDFRRMLESPYFGRIDFFDAQERELLPVYIGRRACMTEDRYDFLVYDWRSPIASMFYDFDCGPAAFDTPQGTCAGEIRLKRQYRIEGGEMRAMYDADALVQDDILGDILSRQAGAKLRDIAQSIQKEQNTAIRFTGNRHMLVLGPAGSGKTSVGMHRMAFLLYHKRGQLTSEDICVVSANHAFSDYISGILPDLFEADLRRTVFADLFERYRPESLRVGTYFEQVEYLLCADEGDARARWIEALYSLDFLEHLRRSIDAAPIALDDIVVEGEVIATRAQAEAFLRAGNVSGYRAVLQRAEHYIFETIRDRFHYQRKQYRDALIERTQEGELDIAGDEELEERLDEMRDAAIDRHRSALLRRNGFDARTQLLRALKTYAWGAATGDEANATTDATNATADAANATADATNAHTDATNATSSTSNAQPACANAFPAANMIAAYAARRASCVLYYEEWIAELCAMAFMGEIEPMTDIRYALIDEAQDVGVPQHMLLRAVFPRASFTLLADPGQVVLPQIATADVQTLDALYSGGLETFPLHKSYRFTGPIGALATALIGGKEAISYYEREGRKPALVRTSSAVDAVRDLLQTPYEGSTAVLTVTQAAAERLYVALGADVSADLLVESGDAAMWQGEGAPAQVMPLFMAKGLEFDRVIVALAPGDGLGTALADNAYYLLCTRALHELFVVCEGEMPEALERCAPWMDAG